MMASSVAVHGEGSFVHGEGSFDEDDGPRHGGFADYEKLRIAGLARHIQTKLYLHTCSKKYCFVVFWSSSA